MACTFTFRPTSFGVWRLTNSVHSCWLTRCRTSSCVTLNVGRHIRSAVASTPARRSITPCTIAPLTTLSTPTARRWVWSRYLKGATPTSMVAMIWSIRYTCRSTQTSPIRKNPMAQSHSQHLIRMTTVSRDLVSLLLTSQIQAPTPPTHAAKPVLLTSQSQSFPMPRATTTT